MQSLTRDEVRRRWEASGITYEHITRNDIRALDGFLAVEYANHEREGFHMEMHPPYRKKYQPQVNEDKDGCGIKSAFLYVSGFYFSGREAVSFNEDGFIGFAGWADDRNVQPVLKAFCTWLSWMGGASWR